MPLKKKFIVSFMIIFGTVSLHIDVKALYNTALYLLMSIVSIIAKCM